MSKTEQKIVEELCYHARHGKVDTVRIEAIHSLSNYLNNSKAVDELGYHARHVKSDSIRVAALRALGQRE